MHNVVAEVEGQMLARSEAARAKAIAILRSARRPPLWAWLISAAMTIAVMVGLTTGLNLPFWPTVIISGVCVSYVSTLAAVGHDHRQLLAAIDLLLLNEDQKR